MEALSKILHHSNPGREAAQSLVTVKQGKRTIMDYSIEFQTVAADSGWNDADLLDAFLRSLSEAIKDQLAPLTLPTDLESMISLATQLDM